MKTGGQSLELMHINQHTRTKSSAGCHSSYKPSFLGENVEIESIQDTYSLAVIGILEFVITHSSRYVLATSTMQN